MGDENLQDNFKQDNTLTQSNICFTLDRFCIKHDQPVAALHLKDSAGILKDYIAEDGLSYFDVPTMRILIHLIRHSTFTSFRNYLKEAADELEGRIGEGFQLCSSPIKDDLRRPINIRNNSEEWGGLNNMFGKAISQSKLKL